MRNYIDARTVYAGDVDAVFGTQTQIGKAFAVDFGTSYDDTARNEFAFEFAPFGFEHHYFATEKCQNRLFVLRIADHENFIAAIERTVGIGDKGLAAVVRDARYYERTVDERSHRCNGLTRYAVVGNLNRKFCGELVFAVNCLQSLVLLCKIDMQQIFQHDERDDYGNDAERIRNGETHRYRRVVHSRNIDICLLCSTHCGSICHGTRQNAHHRLQRHAADDMEQIGNARTCKHNEQSDKNHAHTALTKRRKETRSNLQTYRKDE